MKKAKISASGFVTKDDLAQSFSKAIERLEKYIDFKLEPVTEMAKDYHSFKDSALKSLDWLMSKYRNFEDEHTVLSDHNRQLFDKADNHAVRLNRLEKKSTPS